MIISYFNQHKTELRLENLTYSGFICPYSKENCLHIDSLSMTRTVNCNVCSINRYDKKTENEINVSAFIYNSN